MPSNKLAGGSSDSGRRPSSKELDDYEVRSSTLWVGNLSLDTTDPDLMAVFAKFGALDCTTMRGSRTYTFMYFRSIDEAAAAKEALQGAKIKGNEIKIEFARPAKAAKQIWVGGFSSLTTKEQLENEFMKFGKIEAYKFFHDRNSAIIEYFKMEDAIVAHKTMNGKRLAGEQLRIDFLRSQPPRRDWPDYRDSRTGDFSNRNLASLEQSLPPDDLSFLALKRHMSHGVHRDGHPSSVLWVGYPPSVQIDEQMLHNAMILFGEIERIKCFPSRHYSFVEFRSVDEARRAKEGLQGRLFNDPRIQILFSNSELAPSKDSLTLFPGIRGPGPDLFINDVPLGPLELLGSARSIASKNFPGTLHPNGLPGANILMRPLGTQGIDPRHAGPDFHDFSSIAQNIPNAEANKPLQPSWKRPSPTAPGILPSPGRAPLRSMPDEWDGLDMREPKRSRLENLADDGYLHARRFDSVGGEDQPAGFPQSDRGAFSRSRLSPVIRGQTESSPSNDYIWRGVIAKGGSHVCHARCIPIGRGIDSPLPEVVNCSARTGLDMLTKHYIEATGFDIVFFLPDSEEDFASYTEFLWYLGSKSRAGVAKLDNGTTLFLVPPSDFLTKVLNVNGPERLYGVVLKFPHQATGVVVQEQQQTIPPLPSRYPNRQDTYELHKVYSFNPQRKEQALKLDYNQHLHEEASYHVATGKSQLAHADEPRAAHSVALDQSINSSAASKTDVSLTPELIATLASLIPSNTQSSATGAVQMPPVSSARPASSSSSMANEGLTPYQGWKQEHQAILPVNSLEQSSQLPQHLVQQISNQAQAITQFSAYSNVPGLTELATQPIIGSSQVQNPPLPQTLAPRTLNNYTSAQGGQFSSIQNNPNYSFDASSSYNNYGMFQTATAADILNPAIHHQSRPSLSSNGQFANMPQDQIPISLPTDRSNLELGTQEQQVQTLSGSETGTSQSDADKNQRYQSTLQFAASLLLQIQQQQQQASTRALQGSGNQQ